MKPSDAAKLVTIASHIDNRDPSREAAEAWAAVLTAAGVESVPDCVAAIGQHFAESTDYLVPAEIIRRVKEIRRRRLVDAGTPDLPPGLNQIEERRWAKAWRNAIAAGASREEATAATDRAAGIVREIEAPRPVAQLLAGSGFGKSVAS